ncbi:MAG: type II toxin-antitoxin system VapC family toxin [Rhodocyclaceae bacterium]|nr:type II toxin-antitoxin system VapC family toxin [Rhodocyclaceae bacterium]MDZ4214698.1 type II toxin-antitoxin system VapC family toxin [Rhodocyclaceae bacterium]
MRLLIDTQILLWVIYQPEKLSPALGKRLCDGNVDVYFSAVSIAEIAIKSSLGRADFPFQAEEVAQAARDTDFLELPLDVRHSIRLATLIWHHRDPFDRLLVAQAIEEGVRFVTADRLLAAYSDLVEIL